MSDAPRHAAKLTDRARECIDIALDEGMLGAHTAHWDRTGGSGSGCPACKANAEARQRLYEARAALAETARLIAEKDAEIATLRERLEWRPIETCPQTGVYDFWLTWADDVAALNPPLGQSSWAHDQLFRGYVKGWSAIYKATHWKPLPDPPDHTDPEGEQG